MSGEIIRDDGNNGRWLRSKSAVAVGVCVVTAFLAAGCDKEAGASSATESPNGGDTATSASADPTIKPKSPSDPDIQTPADVEVVDEFGDDPCNGQVFEKYGIADDMEAVICVEKYWRTKRPAVNPFIDSIVTVPGEYTEFSISDYPNGLHTTPSRLLARYKLSFENNTLIRTS